MGLLEFDRRTNRSEGADLANHFLANGGFDVGEVLVGEPDELICECRTLGLQDIERQLADVLAIEQR